jgi:hypothetical protein
MSNETATPPGRLRRALAGAETEQLGALMLLGATLAAILWANLGSGYDAFWGTDARIGVGGCPWAWTSTTWSTTH